MGRLSRFSAFLRQPVRHGRSRLTIAKRLGHQDGGILVGKIYRHLNDEHQRNAEQKMLMQYIEFF